jgi:transcriptional regulator with XRE-family HTH domain
MLREALGDMLRARRVSQRRTLRDVSSAAQVSLGYLSEVERGRKEASSELLGSICGALDLPLSELLRDVSDVIALSEGRIPARSQHEEPVPTGDVRPERLASAAA